MLDWLPFGPLFLALGGFAGGLYLACRFDWPRRIYARIFGAGA